MSIQMLSKWLAFVASTLAMASAASAFAPTPNVDLHDLATYGKTPAEKVFAKRLIAKLNSSPAQFGLPNLHFVATGLKKISAVAIYSAHIQNAVSTSASTQFDLYVLYSTGGSVHVSKVPTDVSTAGVIVTKSARDFDLAKLKVSAQIDIFNRQVAISEPTSGLLKYDPVALGSLVHHQIDNAATPVESLSPVINHAILSRRHSELSRTFPDYYRGRPFLRVVNLDQKEYEGFTPFGLHYKIDATFNRGFISNGCFRLRDKDLYELSTMVFTTDSDGVGLSIISQPIANNRHPLPQVNTWFNSPRVSHAPDGSAFLLKDQHGLYIFDLNKRNPIPLLMAN